MFNNIVQNKLMNILLVKKQRDNLILNYTKYIYIVQHQTKQTKELKFRGQSIQARVTVLVNSFITAGVYNQVTVACFLQRTEKRSFQVFASFFVYNLKKRVLLKKSFAKSFV